MSVFSEYLTIIKNKRNLNSAEVANICGIDTTVIFRWLKGERIPEDINKLRRLELKLRLSENEKDELEDAYIMTVHGEAKYKDFKDIIRILLELRRYRDEGKLCKTDKALPELSFVSESNANLCSNSEAQKKFKNLEGKSNIINGIEECLAGFRIAGGRQLYIINSSMNKEVSAIIRVYCNNADCDIKHIVCSQNDRVSYGLNNSNLELLWEAIDVVFQNSNTDIYLAKSDSVNEVNWILSDYFFIQYNNDMTEGIMTTYKEWIDMQKQMFEYIKSRSSVMGKNEVKNISYTKRNYSANTVIKCIEYYPYLAGVSKKQSGFMIKEIKCFFSEKGLKEFMNKGVLGDSSLRGYPPLAKGERCRILRECVRLSREGKNIYYLIKDSRLSDLKNIHIEYTSNDECSGVKIDVNNVEGKRERLVLTDEGILNGFENFFECVENEKFVYGREETEEYMLRVAEEYEGEIR